MSTTAFGGPRSLNGNASYDANGDVYTLTPDAQWQVGSVMSTKLIDLGQDFNLSFQVFLGTKDAGADGMAFVLHSSPAGSNAIGVVGGGLGSSGIADGLSLEFDTYKNFGDPTNDHATWIDTDNGAVSPVLDLGNIEDGQWHDVTVSWDASTQNLSYTVDNQQGATLNTDVGATFFGGAQYVHFGFAGATGGASNQQQVRAIDVQATLVDSSSEQPPPPNGTGFSKEIIASGLNQPISFAVAPDGRIFVTEKAGVVKVIQDGQVVSTFLDINEEVQSGHDRGMMGIALDPNFESNGHVYIQYAVEVDPSNPDNASLNADAGGRLIRITADADNPNVADLSSRVVIQDNHRMTHNTHSVGDVDFDNDGNLIFTWGDGGFNPTLRLEAQDPNSVQGKVFRINPETFEGVPENPFYDADNPDGIASRVWALGIRNSWKLTVDRATGDVYIGEVTDQGPEEVNVIRADGSTLLNFGWPYFEDNIRTSYGSVPPGFEYERAWIALPHTENGGGDAILGGTVFRGDAYPDIYDGRYFFGNLNQGLLYSASPAGNFQQFGELGEYAGVVDLQMGPDGHLWAMSLFTGELYRIVSDGTGSTNTDPIAKASASLSAGADPLDVTFDATATTDADGDTLVFEWDFDSDGTVDATGAVVTHTFQTAGRSTTTLTVSDGAGGTDTETIEIDVLDSPPNDGNLALGRPTTQSGVQDGGRASRAVDGNTAGDFSTGSVTQTLQTRTPLWEVDLGSLQDIGEIQIFSRTDGGTGSSMQDYWILVSPNPFSSGNLDAARADPGVWSFNGDGPIIDLASIPVNASGQYVRIQLAGQDDTLSLAEVKVFEASAPINNAPTALDDSARTSLDQSVAIDVLANDTDLDGDILSIDSFTQASNGTVVTNSDGTLRYTPNAGFSGIDAFTYTVGDGSAQDTATVNVIVAGALDASAFNFNGNASHDATTDVYTLTPDASWQVGSVISNQNIDLKDDFTVTFEMFSGFKDAGADGMAFVLHNSVQGTAALGEIGGGLGSLGIDNGLALEFDTYQNRGELANDHATWADTDARAVSSSYDLGNLEDGNWRNVTISWDADTKELGYSIGATNWQTTTLDIVPTFFGGSEFVHFGFTGATGGASNVQQIRSLDVQATLVDPPAEPPPPPPPPPVPTDTIDALGGDVVISGNASNNAETGVITLTPDAKWQLGSVTATQRIDLAQDFDLSFRVSLGTKDGGADGMSFVLHNSPDGANAVGAIGGGLGSYGIANGLSLEIDTYQNRDDIANDHATWIDTDARAVSPALDLGNIEDGAWHDVLISWDADSQTLDYSIDGNQGSSLNTDISQSFFGGSQYAYLGFTGATGGGSNLQQIDTLQLQATLEDGTQIGSEFAIA